MISRSELVKRYRVSNETDSLTVQEYVEKKLSALEPYILDRASKGYGYIITENIKEEDDRNFWIGVAPEGTFSMALGKLLGLGYTYSWVPAVEMHNTNSCLTIKW